MRWSVGEIASSVDQFALLANSRGSSFKVRVVNVLHDQPLKTFLYIKAHIYIMVDVCKIPDKIIGV